MRNEDLSKENAALRQQLAVVSQRLRDTEPADEALAPLTPRPAESLSKARVEHLLAMAVAGVFLADW